jgi:outer membrane protein TolC
LRTTPNKRNKVQISKVQNRLSLQKFESKPRPAELRLLMVATLSACALLAVPERSEGQVSLTTVVELAQKNSSAVKLAEADMKKAMATLAEAKDVYIPSVELGSGLPAVPSIGFTGGVPSLLNGTVQSQVFNLPQIKYIQGARYGVKAAAFNLKDAREQVALDASTAYIELDTLDRELEAVHQQEGFGDRLVAIEQERTEAGVDPLSELLQARLTAAQLKLKRLHLEARAGTLVAELGTLTGLPVGSVLPDSASLPEIPAVTADHAGHTTNAIQAAEMIAISKQKVARGALLEGFLPQISFDALYNRNTTILNDFNAYYSHLIPTNSFSNGFNIQIPLFNMARGAKGRESAADALRATVEAEQARQQNDIQIASLTGSLRELDTLAEIASLKQQIAGEQLKAVLSQLELGNGASSGPGAAQQLTPKAEQLARIDERQKYQEALDAGLDLAKVRLNLLRALGHMQDWLNELHTR